MASPRLEGGWNGQANPVIDAQSTRDGEKKNSVGEQTTDLTQVVDQGRRSRVAVASIPIQATSKRQDYPKYRLGLMQTCFDGVNISLRGTALSRRAQESTL